MGLTVGGPALTLGVKRGLLMRAKRLNLRRLVGQELLILRQLQRGVFDAQRITSQRKIPADGEQLFRRDRIKADLVEEAQQPRLTVKVLHGVIAIPHLQRPSDKLIPARPLHAVDAEVGPTNAHRVFRRPGASRVVFGGHQTMTRIERCRNRRTQVDIPQPHHQIAGVEHRFIDLIDIRQIVDTTDKLQVARTPWRIPAHGGHVFVDGLLARRIVPGERQPDHA